MITAPESGFEQDEGTVHLRMTNLIFDDYLMDESMDRTHILTNSFIKNILNLKIFSILIFSFMI